MPLFGGQAGYNDGTRAGEEIKGTADRSERTGVRHGKAGLFVVGGTADSFGCAEEDEPAGQYEGGSCE